MPRLHMRKILITGIAGFIGFHLARHLSHAGDNVFGIDNFNHYYDPALKRGREASLQQEGIQVIECDICDTEQLLTIIKENQITHLVHLAAQAGVRYSLDNPQAYIKANVEGFLSVLEACKQNLHIPLIYASSSSVYGLNTEVPFRLEDRTDKQASLYGVTKKTNELMASTYYHLYGLRSVGLRFFTVYGPWGRPDMAYFKFANAITNRDPIHLYNYGEMERDFTYIDDIVQGIQAAIDYPATCNTFNLGNSKPEKLCHLIELLESELGTKAIIEPFPMQSGDVVKTFSDISLSQTELGYHPKTSLDEGIKRFVSWYKSVFNNSNKAMLLK